MASLDVHGRRFALDHRKGDAVDKQHDVQAAEFLAAGALERELGRHMEDVVFRVVPVNVAQGEALGVALNGLFQALAQPQEIVDQPPGVLEPLGERHVLQRLDAPPDVRPGERVGAAFELDRVDLLQLGAQDVFQEDARGPPAAQRQGLFRGQVLVAHLLQQGDGGQLRLLFFRQRPEGLGIVMPNCHRTVLCSWCKPVSGASKVGSTCRVARTGRVAACCARTKGRVHAEASE